jgi:hypothetical protein
MGKPPNGSQLPCAAMTVALDHFNLSSLSLFLFLKSFLHFRRASLSNFGGLVGMGLLASIFLRVRSPYVHPN